jgi:hypothetical protein
MSLKAISTVADKNKIKRWHIVLLIHPLYPPMREGPVNMERQNRIGRKY